MQIAWPGGPAAGPKGDGGHADRGNRGRGRPRRPGHADRRSGAHQEGRSHVRRRPEGMPRRRKARRQEAQSTPQAVGRVEKTGATRQAAEITPPGSRSRQEDPSHADRRPGSRRCADWGTPAGGRVTWEATRIRRQAAGAGAGRPGREVPAPRRQDRGHQGSSPGALAGGQGHADRRPEPRRQPTGALAKQPGHTGRRLGPALGGQPERRRRPADRTEATREAARARRQAAGVTPTGGPSRVGRRRGHSGSGLGTPAGGRGHAGRRPGSRRQAARGRGHAESSSRSASRSRAARSATSAGPRATARSAHRCPSASSPRRA